MQRIEGEMTNTKVIPLHHVMSFIEGEWFSMYPLHNEERFFAHEIWLWDEEGYILESMDTYLDMMQYGYEIRYL